MSHKRPKYRGIWLNETLPGDFVAPAFLRDGARLGNRRRDACHEESMSTTRFVVSVSPNHLVVRNAGYRCRTKNAIVMAALMTETAARM